MRTLSIPLALGVISSAAFAAEATDKSHYHLFNPTPTTQMREMATDRPDKTESPFTVDAGHFQVESDLAMFTYDHDTAGGANTKSESWDFAALNLKVGLCNFSDLQVMLAPHSRVRTADRLTQTVNRQSGFGDITTRLKVNLWGNDGGQCAGAIMPFVKFPTSQDKLGNHALEGGLIVPVSFELPAGFSCGVMTELDWNQDSALSDYHPEYINTITFARDIVGNLGGYVEFFSLVSGERNAPWVGTFDFGFTYAFTENVQLDAGLNIGVTKSAPDWNPFLGLSVRF